MNQLFTYSYKAKLKGHFYLFFANGIANVAIWSGLTGAKVLSVAERFAIGASTWGGWKGEGPLKDM